MIRFLPVPKDPHANVLFAEFTDHDGMLEAMRQALVNSRIMIQVHDNRYTAAFLSFFYNGNVAVWPKKIFTPEDTERLSQFFRDMLRQCQQRIFRTIVGENEDLTLQALVSSGWQQDGTWREVGRDQNGQYFDGIILTFDGKERGDEFIFREPQTEDQNHTDDDTAGGSAVLDPSPLPAEQRSELAGGDLWPVQIWYAAHDPDHGAARGILTDPGTGSPTAGSER